MSKRDYNKDPLRIFIAVGHGGPDPGAVSGGLREADCNLAIAMLMNYDLRRHGVQVKLSRVLDVEDRLKTGIAACNAYAPDFAIAIHTNASKDGKASGFEVYHQLESWVNSKLSIRMAELFDQNVSKYLGVPTRGLKTDGHLGWLKQVKAPCILVENFFINGPKAGWYSDPIQLDKLSKAYVYAILAFFGVPYRGDDLQTLRYKIVHDDLQTARDCNCSALLVNGNHYVHLRQFVKTMGFAVYYDTESRKTVLYLPEYFAESDFQNCLVKLSDVSSATERVLLGLTAEPFHDYGFDEYDYNDMGKLEQIQWLSN